MKVHGAGPVWWSAASLDGTVGIVQCVECRRLCVPRSTKGSVYPRRHRRREHQSKPWCPGSNIATELIMVVVKPTDPL